MTAFSTQLLYHIEFQYSKCTRCRKLCNNNRYFVRKVSYCFEIDTIECAVEISVRFFLVNFADLLLFYIYKKKLIDNDIIWIFHPFIVLFKSTINNYASFDPPVKLMNFVNENPSNFFNEHQLHLCCIIAVQFYTPLYFIILRNYLILF